MSCEPLQTLLKVEQRGGTVLSALKFFFFVRYFISFFVRSKLKVEQRGGAVLLALDFFFLLILYFFFCSK